jgi:hypothetical protein
MTKRCPEALLNGMKMELKKKWRNHVVWLENTDTK